MTNETKFDVTPYLELFRKDYAPRILEGVRIGLVSELEKYLEGASSPAEALRKLEYALSISEQIKQKPTLTDYLDVRKVNEDNFGKLVRENRKRSYLTQKQLAEKLAVGLRTVQNWESGKVIPWSNTKEFVYKFFKLIPQGQNEP